MASCSEPAAPASDCPLCPRLASFRAQIRAAEPRWHNAPVPSFGRLGARLLVVGLAPGLRGANRTGRPFTGDFAGELLYRSLLEAGLAEGSYQADPDDGLDPTHVRIVNAVRCVPPANKPLPAEIASCNAFLAGELAQLPEGGAVLALGRIAHDATLRALGLRASSARFVHGALYDLPGGRILADSYHVSRYNQNTGRLTPEMFRAVLFPLADRIRGSASLDA